MALEDRATAGLALGHHGTVAAELEALTAAHPLRERLWALRALALTRSGRQADALEVLRRLREVLDEELGLEPSAELRDLQTAVLRQDPALDWVAPQPGTVPTVPPAAPVVPPAPARPLPEPVAPWALAGREQDLDALDRALAGAVAGSPTYAVLTGEPGIGKTRLAAEIALRARDQGVRILVGRCSQDDGAPPLWPWRAVLGAIGAELDGEEAAEDEGAQFRAWERITRVIREASREQATLVVLDDLHWADPSTLRVLRLLVETADATAAEQLMVLATWRAHPEPTGVLADVAESLARKHAVRLELSGLPTRAVVELLARVSERPVSEELADQLRDRTDGNPFFLVEFARLAGERADLDELTATMPTAVSEVLTRRLARLPDETVASLRTAAVIGRQFDAPTLAAATGIDEDDLLDVVEPAQAAGLVREDGIDRFLFSHALIRDTLISSMSASRQARAHTRVARVLSGAPGRETEVARHWLAAGPSHAAEAWRAAAAAAEVARGLHAYEELVELLGAALDSLGEDPGATARDRYDLLMALVDAYRWSALLPELVQTVELAVDVAEEMDDLPALARSAGAATQDVLWRSAPPGEVNERVMSALRRCLDELPAADGDLRCRSMLALANELSTTATVEERRALLDEALAMARRLDDPRLRLAACQVAYIALWTVETAQERLALATEAMELATAIGHERGFVVSATLRAVVLGELGRPREMREAADVARREAERLRIVFGQLVLDGAELPWLAMAGRFDECERLIEHIHTLASRISHNFAEEAVAGSLLSLRLWQGRPLEAVPVLEGIAGQAHPLTATITVYLWRGGEHERARAHHAEFGVQLDDEDDLSLLTWCHAAEISLHLGEPELAARCYELLVPYAGYSCCAGSTLSSGPVDAWLAMAAAATGEKELAGRHADDALALADDWEIPLVADWIRDQRDAYSY